MIAGYSLSQIYEEIAFIAYHFHWSHEEIVNMEHKERQKWVREISQINQNLSGRKEKNILDFT
jgi:transcriptional antiterminator